MSSKNHIKFSIDKKGIGNRLREAIQALGFSKNVDFFNKTGIREATFYAIIKEDRKPNSKTMQMLESAGINPDWLLTGKGEMLVEKNEENLSFDDQVGNRQKVSEILTKYRAEDENSDEILRILLKFLAEMRREDLIKLRKMLDIILEQ